MDVSLSINLENPSDDTQRLAITLGGTGIGFESNADDSWMEQDTQDPQRDA